MVNDSLGHIQDNIYVLGISECPIFLADAPRPAIFDAGISCAGKIYVEAIRSILGDRQPAILFLTHVHWDHCGAVSYLKNAFPSMKVAASALAADIIKRPNAVALITKLNEYIYNQMIPLPDSGSLLTGDPFTTFPVDIELHDNQIIDLGDGTMVQVLATPGHTQDHYSFYFPGNRVLIAGEAGGVYYGPQTVSTEFVSDYNAYLHSLQRLADLPVETFCQGHYQYLQGQEEISRFFEQSVQETIYFKTRVMELLEEEEGSIERVMPRLKTERYDVIPGPKQPEAAYLLNLKAQVSHLAGHK